MRVGEDGPTHQPIEQLESLRVIPGLTELRPGDAAETALVWELAPANVDGPTALVLSRQDLPVLGGHGLDDVRALGARTVRAPSRHAEVVLAATGSEVGLALAAEETLAADGVAAEVISVMCRERLDEGLRDGRMPRPDVPAVWVEAGVPIGWRAVAAPRDVVLGLERFGESGPGQEVAAHLGLSAASVARAVSAALGKAPDLHPEGDADA